MFLKILVIVLFAVYGMNTQAADYWVVGSYMNVKSAQQETARIIAAGSIDIKAASFIIEGEKYIRLLISAHLYDEKVKRQLASLGIKPWCISLNQNQQTQIQAYKSEYDQHPAKGKKSLPASEMLPDKNGLNLDEGDDEADYVAVAEFENISEALELEQALRSLTLGVRSRAIFIQDKVIHQVWVGPLDQQLFSEVQMLVTDLDFGQLMVKPTQPEFIEFIKGASAKPPKLQPNQHFNLATLPGSKLLLPQTL